MTIAPDGSAGFFDDASGVIYQVAFSGTTVTPGPSTSLVGIVGLATDGSVVFGSVPGATIEQITPGTLALTPLIPDATVSGPLAVDPSTHGVYYASSNVAGAIGVALPPSYTTSYQDPGGDVVGGMVVRGSYLFAFATNAGTTYVRRANVPSFSGVVSFTPPLDALSGMVARYDGMHAVAIGTSGALYKISFFSPIPLTSKYTGACPGATRLSGSIAGGLIYCYQAGVSTMLTAYDVSGGIGFVPSANINVGFPIKEVYVTP